MNIYVFKSKCVCKEYVYQRGQKGQILNINFTYIGDVSYSNKCYLSKWIWDEGTTFLFSCLIGILVSTTILP